MGAAWNVLVVDDEEDIHDVTKLALKRKSWRGRPVVLTHVRSGAEAREMLLAKDAPRFHAALVDVVMETDDAGLQLCDFIRSHVARSTRIILRTGQPGLAPPDQVLNDYDIDFYLAKTEVTDKRLYGILRACFRSSIDIATLQQVGEQLKLLTTALQDAATTRETLANAMVQSLRFVEEKYAAKIAFVHDVNAPPSVDGFDPKAIAQAVLTAQRKGLDPIQLLPGTEVGLPAKQFLVLTARLGSFERKHESVGLRIKRFFTSVMNDDQSEEPVGLVVRFEQPPPTRIAREFTQDLELFLSNWRVVEGSWRLQDQILRERMGMVKSPGGTGI